jgi:hypothetical protein
MAYNRKVYDEWYNATHFEQRKKWREKNKAVLAEKAKAYAIAHKLERKQYLAKYALAHKAQKREYDRAYHQANRDRRHSQSLGWKKAHLDRVAGYNHKRYLKRREHILEVGKVWKRSNPHKVNAAAAKRRAAILQATPKWLTKGQWKQIEAVYKQAVQISKSTGIEHHVDHVWPLQGKAFRGLHVPWNLQVLEGKENYKKLNHPPVRAGI